MSFFIYEKNTAVMFGQRHSLIAIDSNKDFQKITSMQLVEVECPNKQFLKIFLTFLCSKLSEECQA